MPATSVQKRSHGWKRKMSTKTAVVTLMVTVPTTAFTTSPRSTTPFATRTTRSLTRLSIAHTPNVHGRGHLRAGDEMDHDDASSWFSSSSSSSSFDSAFDGVDWRHMMDPQQPPQEHDAISTHTSPTQPPRHLDPLSRQDWQTVGILSGSVLAFLALLMQLSGPGAWRYYLAGGVCAAVSHAIPVPVDVVKTRKQVDPTYAELTMAAATQRLIQSEGLQALLVGMGPTVAGYFVEGAVKFGVYEMLKPWLRMLLPNQFLAFCASATLSGLAAGIMLCPMEALRIRLVAERDYAQQGWIRGGLRMMQREGWKRVFFGGLKPMLYKQIPYTMTKNVSFDFITKFLYRTWQRNTAGTGGSAVIIPLVAAVAASVLSCLSSQPGDMLLSLVNAHEGDEKKRTRDWVRHVYHSGRGVRGFLVGVKTRLVHVGVIVTVQLLIYDFVKRLFGIAATGSV